MADESKGPRTRSGAGWSVSRTPTEQLPGADEKLAAIGGGIRELGPERIALKVSKHLQGSMAKRSVLGPPSPA